MYNGRHCAARRGQELAVAMIAGGKNTATAKRFLNPRLFGQKRAKMPGFAFWLN